MMTCGKRTPPDKLSVTARITINRTPIAAVGVINSKELETKSEPLWHFDHQLVLREELVEFDRNNRYENCSK